jgi:hypothetical protein
LYLTHPGPISGTPAYFSPYRKHPVSFYDATVPAYLQVLSSLSGLLGKAEA